jgi:hypothetical protein
MLRDMFRDTTARVRTESERLIDNLGVSSRLGRLGELRATPKEARRWVQTSLFQARKRSEDSLWTLQLQALDAGRNLVAQAEGVPVLERLGAAAKPVIDRVETAVTAPPLASYDDLNVREVMAALRDLDGFGLRKVARYEAAHRNRKTILDAIEREAQRRERLAARL